MSSRTTDTFAFPGRPSIPTRTQIWQLMASELKAGNKKLQVSEIVQVIAYKWCGKQEPTPEERKRITSDITATLISNARHFHNYDRGIWGLSESEQYRVLEQGAEEPATGKELNGSHSSNYRTELKTSVKGLKKFTRNISSDDDPKELKECLEEIVAELEETVRKII